MKNHLKQNGATYAAMIVIAATVAMPTYAQSQVSRLGYFEPAGKGSNNNQTSDKWELQTIAEAALEAVEAETAPRTLLFRKPPASPRLLARTHLTRFDRFLRLRYSLNIHRIS